jgi:hypothetical protein
MSSRDTRIGIKAVSWGVVLMTRSGSITMNAGGMLLEPALLASRAMRRG